MQNKNLGIILIILTLIILALLFFFKAQFQDTFGIHATPECIHDESQGQICPYEKLVDILPYFYISVTILVVITLLGLYLTFYSDKEKKVIQEYQDKITKRLEDVKKKEIKEDKFNFLMTALNENEQKVIKAVREQDGITQATLRIRTDLSKTKLSFILADLEKKGLITKVSKGKTNQIFLKKAI
ncbi:MAG: winged helix-turn-helix transcriptional regulator [Nanoarchaeota archaeon]